jgi:4a-hydroxytetrahydrobiopterin dehydratase
MTATTSKRGEEPVSDYIKASDFAAEPGVEDWPVVGDGATAFFPTSTLAASLALVDAIGAIPGIEGHRPRIDIRDDGVTVSLITRADDWWGMSRRDVELARAISAIARDQGLRADRTAVQSVGPIVINALDIDRIRPFWAALLGYVQRPDSPDEDLVDPHDRGLGIWFEQLDEQRDVKNKMHVAVWVPFEQAEARVQAAIAAGGTVVFDRASPAWWFLADPEGNEADVSSIATRD